MTEPRFGRVVTAMVTPFHADGSVNYDQAATLAKWLVANGSDGLVVAGSTGEGSALTDDEKLSLFACVAEAVTVPVLAGSTNSNTAQSVALTARVAATGAAGILATTPAYVRPSQKGIALHLGAVAEATELPVMLYDIPSRTGRKIYGETTTAIVNEHANVVALKDASADLEMAAHTKATLGARLDLYSGDDGLLLEFLAIGAVGIVSVASHWAGPEFAGLIHAFEQDNLDTARALQARLAASCTFESSETYPNPLPTKAAMNYLGLSVGDCRLPLGPGDATLDAAAASVVQELHALRG